MLVSPMPTRSIDREPSPGIRSSAVVALVVLLALNFAIRSYVALRPLANIDGLTIPDDAYLSLTVSRNIAGGHGPQYGGQYTNGFQPLYVFLMVAVFKAIPHDDVVPVHLALLLMSVFDTLTLLLLFRFVRRLSRSPFIPILIALLWIAHPRIIGIATNGLETALACFFVTWVLSYFHEYFSKGQPPPGARKCIALGVLLGMAMLARIDCILLAAIVIAAFLWIQRRAQQIGLASAVLVAGSALLVYAPWLVYSFAYTGDFYPVSGSAVRLMSLAAVDPSTTSASFYVSMGQAALRAVAGQNEPLVYLLAGLLVVFLAFRHRLAMPSRGNITAIVVAWIFAASLGSAYVLYIFGPHFFDRYLHPVRVPLLLTIALLLDALFPLIERAAVQAGVALVVAGLVIATQCHDPYFQSLLFGKDTQSLGYRNLGLWAKSTFPAGTVIGGSQTGAVGYFANNLKVVNLDGVVSKPCYESLVRHENLEYVRKEGVQYVFGWKVNFAFLVRMSKGFKPGDITDVKPILGFRSWNADWYVGRVRYPAEAPPPAPM